MLNIINIKDPTACWVLWGIPFIILMASLMHFVYEWSGRIKLVSIFAPINESVWEHLKMPFWPTFLWWSLWYLIYGQYNNISAVQWFSSCSVALLLCPIIIVSFYYTYTGAFGIHSLPLDIFSLFIGVIISQLFAMYIYRYTLLSHYWLYLAIAVPILLIIAFIVYTIKPPHIPLFLDSPTGKYGI